MTPFKCGICGQEHDELLLDLGYSYPADFFKIPAAQRGKRVRIDSDLCVIDDAEYYIRGILPLPITDTAEAFRWGVWALIEKNDFRRYLKLWNVAVISEPPFAGRLSGGLRDYLDSDGLEVRVQLRAGNQRPHFYVVSDSHRLGIDQRRGITMEQVHAFVAPTLPSR